MDKSVCIEFNKKELLSILNQLDSKSNNDLFEKIKSKYLIIVHEEQCEKILSQFYGKNFVRSIYHNDDSNYNEGLMKYTVYFTSINQETQKEEVSSDIELIDFVKYNGTYKYKLVFHKKCKEIVYK